MPVGASRTYQWQVYDDDEDSWENSDEDTADEATFEPEFNDKGPQKFRVKVTIGTTTKTSDPITITWVEGIKEMVRGEDWSDFNCGKPLGYSWYTLPVINPTAVPVPQPIVTPATIHETRIRLGTSDYGLDGTLRDRNACIKARFVSQTSGSTSIRASGILYHYQKKLKASSIATLNSDGLTLEQLKDAYSPSTVKSKADGLLDCTYCMGGFADTSPISVDYQYLKTHSVGVAGVHVIDNNSLPNTGASWDQPMKPLPTACDEAVSLAHIETVQHLGYWIVKELFIDKLTCRTLYRVSLRGELSDDLGSDSRKSAIQDRVEDLLIWPKEKGGNDGE